MFSRRFILKILTFAPFLHASSLFADHHFRTQGKVLVNGKEIDHNSPLKSGDIVETFKGSSAKFKINKEAFLLRENSKFKIESTKSKTFSLLTGAVLSVFGKGKITMKAPTVTAGIRGTAMYIEIEDGGETTYACTCYGKIKYNFNGGEKIVKTKHHDSPFRFKKDGEKTIVEDAPVINHTDEELIELEALHDRIPPFTTQFEILRKKMRGVLGNDGLGGY